MSNWLIEGKLCSFADDAVRIEKGPRLVDLECSVENLSDTVTHAKYKFGKRDAKGRIIDPELYIKAVEASPLISEEDTKKKVLETRLRMQGDKEKGLDFVNLGDTMTVADWRNRLTDGWVWKLYEKQQETRFKTVDGEIQEEIFERFVQVDEFDTQTEAEAAATELAEGK